MKERKTMQNKINPNFARANPTGASGVGDSSFDESLQRYKESIKKEKSIELDVYMGNLEKVSTW